MQSGKHFIVAIGASAGGLEAIHEFFDHMVEGKNLSFVVIQHLSPDYKSLLVELVSRHTHMKVREAEDNLTIEKNCIYVIPNNKLISIRKKKLVLEEKLLTKAPNNAIDIFLYALAKEKRQEAIAIILSGTGTDGTKGIEAIKESGGLVIVQDPSTAKFDGMPNSAIHSGCIDIVAAPSAMPEEIINYTVEPLMRFKEDAEIESEALDEIFKLIHKEAGFDFNYYKTPTILRRLGRRIVRGNFKGLDDYISFLRVNPDECKRLGKDFLIGVTKFFRDEEAFQILKDKILPAILEKKEREESLKIWVCACSTGEEAYSIAIVANEVIESMGLKIDVKIFATDLEQSNIEIASTGTYPNNIEQDVKSVILDKYFQHNGSSYTIIPRIRKQIVFAAHNVIKDPPFIKNDLVSCRNMLIYMSPVLQQRVYNTLLFSVRRYGYLFFGSSENPVFSNNAVIEINSKAKIFQKVAETRLGSSPVMDLTEKSRRFGERLSTRDIHAEGRIQNSLWEDFRKSLTDDLDCAALYIDQFYEIKEAVGNYDKILSLPKKTLKLNLLRMIPMGLTSVLNAAIQKVWRDKEKVVMRNVRYENLGEIYSVQLLVKPPSQRTNYTLVVLTNNQKVEDAVTQGPVHLLETDYKNLEYVRSLESELLETKNNLQIVVEDLETVNEELQSSNEELLSANEELQSSNEELQSLNEELHTLNTEHQIKIRELLELNDDLNNYFRSTDIGQVFLDADLRIRKFNPASAKMINFIESDLGRPISHISTNIRYDHLLQDIERVSKNNEVIEKEVQLVNGKNVLMRVLPYVTRDKQPDGIVISFVDITTITNLNNIIRGVFNSSMSAIIAFQAVRSSSDVIVDFKVLTANYAASNFLKLDESLIGKSLLNDLPVLVVNGMMERYLKVVKDDATLHVDLYMEHNGFWYEVSAVKMMDGFVAAFTDITEKKKAEQRLKKNYTELISVKDNLKRLNAELEEKVAERTRELSLSEERFRLVSRATNDALWDWDFVNNKMWWGEAFFKIFGYEHVGVELNRNFWLDKIHPDDRQVVRDKIYSVINSTEKQWSCEYRFLREDGQYAHVLDRGYVLHDAQGTPYRMLGSILDLSELKLAESEVASNIEQRRFLAESMPLLIWTTNAQGSVNFVNSQFEIYTGIPFRNAIADGWLAAIHIHDQPVLKQIWSEALENRTDFQFEVKVRTVNGDFHWNLLRARARKDKDGNIIDWVVTAVDIHEQKLLNETLEQKVQQRTQELQEINKALEASNHDLQQFASVASHDLQEPLRKIHMFSKLIRDKFDKQLSSDARTYLDKIMTSASRMKSIITNVLNFSRLSADDNTFEYINLRNVIDDVADDFEVAIREREAHLDLGDFCEVDIIPGQVRQLFQNLISNSLKFSKPGVPPVIKISCEKITDKNFDSEADDDGRFCKIVFEDNGIGFDEQFKDHIFGLFHRLHSKDRYEGTGIGLAIVKKIVEKHHGLITVSSEPEAGTKFEFILPVKQIHHQENVLQQL
jgi:two-component system CheB/CheR fusion protein